MPLYDFRQMTRENLVSKDVSKPRLTDQSSTSENDFFELVWGNGQILMQAQSSRASTRPTSKSIQSHTNSAKIRDRDVGNTTDTQMRKFGDLYSGLNEIPLSVPTSEVDLSPNEGMTSWLNYTIDDFLQHDYNSEFLHELTGDTINEIPTSDNCYLRDKRHDCNREFRDCHSNPVRDVSSSQQGIVSRGFSVGEVETTRTKASTKQLYLPSSQQCQSSLTPIRSRVSDITENNPCNATQHSHSQEIPEAPSTSCCLSTLKIYKHDTITPSTSSTPTIINFSHFARPAAVARANLQSMGKKSGLSLARSENMLHMNKGTAATSNNPSESSFIIARSEHPRESNMHCQHELGSFKSDLKKLEVKSLEQKDTTFEQSDHACNKDTFQDDQTFDQVHAESGSNGHAAVEKSIEQAVASSSVCSGNGVEMFSDNSNQNLKRKSRDTKGFECHSEDVEEESGFARKADPARGGTCSKRSRAAEVHNLSERRRRDRINEKMRALQELIPNCNKVDKASMLDEVIEYLKTLQLQVQMMSMGAGLYAPPMMLPHGMQHMHSPASSFPPMGGCMPLGLGMGYALGMPDMSSGSSRFPMIQLPQMQGTHLSVPSMFGPTALHGMARSNPQMFGLCGQGFPISMPGALVLPLSGVPLMNPSALGLNASGTGGIVDSTNSASSSGLEGRMLNVNSQIM